MMTQSQIQVAHAESVKCGRLTPQMKVAVAELADKAAWRTLTGEYDEARQAAVLEVLENPERVLKYDPAKCSLGRWLMALVKTSVKHNDTKVFRRKTQEQKMLEWAGVAQVSDRTIGVSADPGLAYLAEVSGGLLKQRRSAKR